MEWVLLRFKLASFMPWSDVRRIPHVRVGGLSIHISESLSSSKGRRKSGSNGGSNSTDGVGDRGAGDNTRHHEITHSISSDWLAREQQDDHHAGGGAAIAAAAASVGPLMGDKGDNSSGSSYGAGDGNSSGTPRRQRPFMWPSLSSRSFPQPGQQIDRKDSWAHLGRKASVSRASSAGGLDGGSGIGDGYEWERVAHATLEHALGNEFTAKYRVRHERY